MRYRGALVCFSGVDCSGKSTQISLLRGTLEERGFRVAVFWLRPGYSAELDAVRALIRRMRPGLLPAPGNATPRARERAFARKDVQLAWVNVALADLAYQYGVKLRHLLSTHDVVICDRTILDAEIDLELRFPDLTWLWRPAARAILRLSPVAMSHYLLLVEYDEVKRRQLLKQEPFADPESTRFARYAMYERFALRGGSDYYVIRGERPAPEISAEIAAELLAREPLK